MQGNVILFTITNVFLVKLSTVRKIRDKFLETYSPAVTLKLDKELRMLCINSVEKQIEIQKVDVLEIYGKRCLTFRAWALRQKET